MEMPDVIENSLFAPCGMNCLVCYRHCNYKKPCGGCLAGDGGKPEHCRSCAIKDCVRSRGLHYCFQCPEHPCGHVRRLEKSYLTRYGASLTANSAQVRALGLEAFMARQRERYTCPACGGVVSLHDRACSRCGRPMD